MINLIKESIFVYMARRYARKMLPIMQKMDNTDLIEIIETNLKANTLEIVPNMSELDRWFFVKLLGEKSTIEINKRYIFSPININSKKKRTLSLKEHKEYTFLFIAVSIFNIRYKQGLQIPEYLEEQIKLAVEK